MAYLHCALLSLEVMRWERSSIELESIPLQSIKSLWDKSFRQAWDKHQLGKQVKLIQQDYRDIEGKFDKIVSIEMIEAVGHKFLPVYFKQIHHLLKRDGVVGLQMIISRSQKKILPESGSARSSLFSFLSQSA